MSLRHVLAPHVAVRHGVRVLRVPLPPAAPPQLLQQRVVEEAALQRAAREQQRTFRLLASRAHRRLIAAEAGGGGWSACAVRCCREYMDDGLGARGPLAPGGGWPFADSLCE